MEGVYRLSPNARIIETLKAEFDKSEFHDVHSVDGLTAPSSPLLFIADHAQLAPPH